MKFTNIRKKFAPLVLGGVLAVTSAVPVLASEGGSLSSIETALTSSFSEVGSSMLSIVSKILPIAMPVIIAVMLITLGIKVFKKITNKA